MAKAAAETLTILPGPTASSVGNGEPGVWLTFEQLRQLPLSHEARLHLLRELSTTAAADSTQVQLLAEQAELHLRCCEHAWSSGAWLEAMHHHDQLRLLVERLVKVLPQQARPFWSRYGELLASLTAAVHAAVSSQSSTPLLEPLRAELCWLLAERLHKGRQLPFVPPDWLAVLEQQLVQDGAICWIDLQKTTEQPEAPGTPVRSPGQMVSRAISLLVRLDQLLDPAPDWVLELARQQLEAQVMGLLDRSAAAAEPRELAKLLELVQLLPLLPESQASMEQAVTRARLALELLDPELPPLGPLPAPALPVSDLQPGKRGDHPPQAAAPAEVPMAELVLLEAGQSVGPLGFNLAPLLVEEPEGETFQAIEDALVDYIWHLPRGSRAQQAAPALLAALEPAWRAGLRLPAAAFERLAYLAAAWQRRLAEKLEPLPTLDWQHSLLIELDATELAVLQPLLAAPASLEPALATLRREHLNQAFWQERQELPWMRAPSPLEALRRLHVEQGFYARTHEPLQGLLAWGREGVQALLEAEVWTDDAGCLGCWLAVAQELVAQKRLPLPSLGEPPPPEQLLGELGGLEVVYVGDQATVVQAAHRAGRCFRGEPFGLRVLEAPASHWPARPAGSFEESLAVLLEAVDGLHRQRPFAVLLADCGAYRLPLLRAVHQRYGVAALSSGRPMASWLSY